MTSCRSIFRLVTKKTSGWNDKDVFEPCVYKQEEVAERIDWKINTNSAWGSWISVWILTKFKNWLKWPMECLSLHTNLFQVLNKQFFWLTNRLSCELRSGLSEKGLLTCVFWIQINEFRNEFLFYTKSVIMARFWFSHICF